MSVAVVNSILIYKELNPGTKFSLLNGHEKIIKHLLGIQEDDSGAGQSIRSSNSSSSIRSQHRLTKIPRRYDNKIFRKRCTGCYKILNEQGLTPSDARKKAKKTDTQCETCKKAFCLSCYNASHNF
uniref:Uncharacterized protein n=1 Tax=Pectinophora gossypiella TaxID=13191 RepID=A0A1E1WI12_PECGO